jgi:DNA uptake protein ComE-like DNA-binding protein
MASFNPNHQRADTRWRSGPSEEEQTSPPGVTSAELQLVDLNHTTERELCAVDELDPKLVHALINYRVHHGHFESWQDLTKVPGIEARDVASLQRIARIGRA